MKVFINNCNLLSWPTNMADWLARAGHEPVFVDNASTYPPLLGCYEDSWQGDGNWDFRVITLAKNLGHVAPWKSGVIEREADEWYAVTDPDLDLSSLPLDTLDRLKQALEWHPFACKAGVSLEIDDLPETNPLRDKIREWEAQYWKTDLGRGCFRANTDTTLAVYQKSRPFTPGQIEPAIRLGRPYTARHLPWHLSPADVGDEYRYYLEHVKTKTHWTRQLLGGGERMASPESEFTPPGPHCPHPERWTAYDSDATELEVIESIAGLVRALQPEFVLETGTYHGDMARAIGEALKRNGHGRLVSLEPVAEHAAAARKACEGLPVEVLEVRSLDYAPTEPIDFAWLDSGVIADRAAEFMRYKPWLRGPAAFHDTGPQHPLRPVLDRLATAGEMRVVYFRTPRGFALAEAINGL